MSEIIKANPTKTFFIDMLTKDILLQDCILDLADNCIDGATRLIAESEKNENKLPDEEKFRGYSIEITANDTTFAIEDNCGGIPAELAKNRAFYFGRPTSNTHDQVKSIGLYGIGMKRAIFKIGARTKILSNHARGDAFEVNIDVPTWAKEKQWEFGLERTHFRKPAGTRIEVTGLSQEASLHFRDQTFLAEVRRIIARDYSFFLQKGLEIRLNSKLVSPHRFQLREGALIAPMHEEYDDEGVHVTISAGLASLPEDEVSPSESSSEVDYFGWFVACNDRIVLAADKSEATVWGQDEFPVWHPQYNGFMGIATFSSDDPSLLPWSTTKRDVDQLNTVYRRAIGKMKTATRQYTQYSNTRKSSMKAAKQAESNSKPIPLKEIKPADRMKLPELSLDSSYITVSYQAKKDDVKKAAKLMGQPNMAATKVGATALEYYIKSES